LGAVLALIGTLMGSTSGLFGSLATFISKKNESAQFFELIDLGEQRQRGEGDGPEVETLTTRGLAFRYPLTDDYRIKGIDFSLRKGEKVAFVGENGAGKTTFIKLLTGMLEPSAGEVLINGASTKAIGPASRYDAASCVFQEPSRFNTFTIADNVFLGDVAKPRDDGQIDEALAFAAFEGADRDAMLGKDIGGTELSGGQWQKIAIARAYYRGRDFFVLDEPTSNLDPIAEAEVFKQYIAMTRGKTVIMVTHRISVASLADRVVVFRDGEIVEDGTHGALLAKGGEYARLYATQAQWYDR
jgi:ATP-binding cassette subfamily B protein